MNRCRKVRGLLAQASRDQRNASTPAPWEWTALRWRSIHKHVNQLRRRIFRAFDEGEDVPLASARVAKESQKAITSCLSRMMGNYHVRVRREVV